MINRETLRKILMEAGALNPLVAHRAILYWETIFGNPNGDPDTSGCRQDLDGYALVTDVKLKRALRDYAADILDRVIYIERELQEKMGDDLPEKAKAWMLKDWAAHHGADTPAKANQTFWDVRMFGAVYSSGGGSKAQMLGPVQVRMCRSKDPIEEIDVSITRLASEDPNSTRTMGRKKMVAHAEFEQKIVYSGYLGKKSGISEEDLLDLWETLINGLEHRTSTMKGEQRATSLVIHTFDDAIGTFDPQKPPTKTVIDVPHLW